MSFDRKQFEEIITSVLKECELPSDKNSVHLILGTAATESKFGTYLKQKNGPAVGVFQMEPTTHDDLWINFIPHKHPECKEHLISACGKYIGTGWGTRMMTDLYYSIVMCRLHYMRFPETIPNSIEEQAVYYKKYYNTVEGKGSVIKYLEDYYHYVLGKEYEIK